MKTQLLRDTRNEKIQAMQAMLDAEDTALDQAQYDAMQAEVDDLNAKITRQEKLDALHAELAKPLPTLAGERQALAAVIPAVNDHPVRGPEAKTEFENIGDFAAAVLGGRDQRLSSYHQELSAEQQMGSGASGGFAVPTQFIPELLKVDPAATPLRAMCRTIPAGPEPDAEVSMPALDQTGAAPDHQYGGVTVQWTGEGDAAPETSLNLREVKLKAEEVSAHVAVTEKLLRNWPATSMVINNLLGAALGAAIEDTIYNGSGVAKPEGILQSAALYKVNRGTALTVGFGDLSEMEGRLLERGGVAIWIINQALKATLRQLKNDNNELIWSPGGAIAGSPGTLLGKSLFWHEFTAAKGSLGDIALVQPSYYLCKEGVAPVLAAGRINDDFTRRKQRLMIFSSIDGHPWLTEPFRLRNGYEVSPFVALDVPA